MQSISADSSYGEIGLTRGCVSGVRRMIEYIIIEYIGLTCSCLNTDYFIVPSKILSIVYCLFKVNRVSSINIMRPKNDVHVLTYIVSSHYSIDIQKMLT